jgi:hypothetical protein
VSDQEHSMVPEKKWVAIFTRGLIYGPFDTCEQAQTWAWNVHRTIDGWQVASLHAPRQSDDKAAR